MVGLNEFGEAAWSLEQLLNTWLAEQKPASEELVHLSHESLMGFGRWVEDIAKVSDPGWNAQAFRDAADGLRLNNKVVTLRLPGGVQPDGAAADSAWAPTGWGADLQLSCRGTGECSLICRDAVSGSPHCPLAEPFRKTGDA